MKKLFTLLFLTAFTLVGYAKVIASGYCGGEGDGTNLKWELTDAGTLTISGTGIMGDYTSSNKVPWYNYMTEIEDVSLQEGVTRIGNYAFSGCSSLTNIEIPSSVTSIGRRAFYECSSLTSVVIPEGVTSIGSYAFSECSSLTNIEIPSSVTSIGGDAFYNCSSLENIDVSANNAAYSSLDGVLFNKHKREIVRYPGGKAVSYTIPSSVTNIGDHAFSSCSSLTSIEIPFSVSSIGSWAFSSCSSLTSITSLNPEPPELEFYSFSDVDVNIPVYVPAESIELYLTEWSHFTNFLPFEGVIVPTGYCGAEGDGYNLTWGLTDNGVLNINGTGDMEDWSYYYRAPWYGYRGDIKSVNISEGVTSIGYSAFSECTSLTSVVIPEGVTRIGRSAFSGCSSLTSVVIPEGVTSIGNDAFSGCSSLTSVVIPEGVTSIGNDAFSGCSSLTSVVIPEGVTSIGNGAFYGCSSLTNIEIPSSVTRIGGSAFSRCSSLTSVVIPEGVTSIGGRAFYNCSSLESVVIPEGVTSIGEWAFYNCSSLESVVIPEGVTSIGVEAFYNCSSLTNIKIPSSVKSIGECAFSGSSLMSVNISEGVTEIWSAAFSSCSSLTSVVIPSSVTSIGRTAFNNCSSLMSVVIPEGVTSIGGAAFNNCSSLESVVIPSSVTSIGDKAFYNCSSLTSITSLNPEPPKCATDAFSDVYNITVYVSDNEIVNLYKAADVWKSFSKYIAIIVASGECGAYGDNLLWSLSYKGLLTITGSGNMQNYTADNPAPWDKSLVKNIVVEAGAATIGTYAFSGCDNLESVEFPENLLSIGTNAFEGCGRLQQVEMKSGGMSIGSSAFANCTQLKSVVLPAEMRSIGNNAFDNCFSIERIVSYNTVPPTVGANGAFAEVPIYIPVYVPQANMDDYLSASGWNYFFNFQPIDKLWSGVCGSENGGSNLSWELDRETGVLSVSGSGSMADYNGAATPWYAGDIREIVIAEGATTIGAGAFIGCTALENVEIAATVTEIGEYAFAGCGAIGEMICKNLVPPTCVGNAGGSLRNSSTGNYDGVFDGIDPAIPVYVPAESIELYRNAEGWNYFTNFLPIPDDEEDDEQGTFVEETSDVEASVYARAGMIYCDGVAEFEIYNLVGQEVSNKNGSLKGMYIVVAGEEVLKLMVD